MSNKKLIEEHKAVLGIELGSTRIKAVLLNDAYETIASGGYDWENQLVEGIWTYDLNEVHKGIKGCYEDLNLQVQQTYGISITGLAGIGISAMMHGYLVFDLDMNLLVPFRTWRNTMTLEASEVLTKAFNTPIPQRWSASHLYHAISHQESHVKDIGLLTTLSGYIHWILTGEKVIGLGEASGMFPVNPDTLEFDQDLLELFDHLTDCFNSGISIEKVLPDIRTAGAIAGHLTEAGALFLDSSGVLKAGIAVCPPEGDAAAGMIATNSIKKRTGNISAGTSIFAMVVLEKNFSKAYAEIAMLMTPTGAPVALVHGNNGTSDLNAWVGLFRRFTELLGVEVSVDMLYKTLYNEALEGDPDCAGLLAYNYLSGEHITHLEEGRPIFVRKADSHFNLANFMKVHLYTTLGAISTGMSIMMDQEGVKIDSLVGHGGLFKTEVVGQQIVSNALDVPISVMDTAGEGGAWGMAVLAGYMSETALSLEDYLDNKVFKEVVTKTVKPVAVESEGFKVFMKRYNDGLAIERAAVNHLK